MSLMSLQKVVKTAEVYTYVRYNAISFTIYNFMCKQINLQLLLRK